jgi:geranylgeranyl diphosphate synthase type I
MTITPHRTGGREHSRTPSALTMARNMTLPCMRAAIEGLHPDTASVCAHHFAWDQGGGGKCLRGAVVLLTATAAGGEQAAALPGAVAVELMHNFSLLHDDIMDDDEQRRGRPTAWLKFGTGQALLAGDALLGLSLRTLSDLPGDRGQAAATALLHAYTEMVDGQAADLALDARSPSEVTEGDYLAAVPKTTALIGCCATLGACLAGTDAPLGTTLRSALMEFALAWQIANDLEDIWGDPAATGKPALSDLKHGKKTLPLITALRSNTPEADRLAELLATTPPQVTEDGLRMQAELIEKTGARAEAEARSRQHLHNAVTHLSEALPPTRARTDLEHLIQFVVTRSLSN